MTNTSDRVLTFTDSRGKVVVIDLLGLNSIMQEKNKVKLLVDGGELTLLQSSEPDARKEVELIRSLWCKALESVISN